MPMPNMIMPRSVTVWGTDHKNAPGMKYAQRTTKKTIYVKYRPTNPLSIPIHFIIQKTPFCTPILRITNSKTAIGEKKILCLKKETKYHILCGTTLVAQKAPSSASPETPFNARHDNGCLPAASTNLKDKRSGSCSWATSCSASILPLSIRPVLCNFCGSSTIPNQHCFVFVEAYYTLKSFKVNTFLKFYEVY